MAGREGAGREPRLDRRSWLVAAGLGLGAATARADDPPLTPDEAKAREEALARAKEAGLPRLKLHASPRFFALSDASEAFTRQALAICEDLLTDYLAYFPPRKFAVRPPSRRMTLVILASPKEQVRFLGDDDEPDDADPVFDPDANRLVFFDLRAGGGGYRANRERGNTVTLCHEAALLIFDNTGLLHPTPTSRSRSRKVSRTSSRTAPPSAAGRPASRTPRRSSAFTGTRTPPGSRSSGCWPTRNPSTTPSGSATPRPRAGC